MLISQLLEEKETMTAKIKELEEKVTESWKVIHEEISKELIIWLKRNGGLHVDICLFPNRTYGDVNNYYDMEILFNKNKLLFSFDITKHNFENPLGNDITHCYKLTEYDDELDSMFHHSIHMKFKNSRCSKLSCQTGNTRKFLPTIEMFTNLLPDLIQFIDRRRYLYAHYDVKSVKYSMYLLLHFYKFLPFPKDITLKILKMVL